MNPMKILKKKTMKKKTMKRPDKILVLSNWFEIHWLDQAASDATKSFGTCNTNTQVITISCGMKPTLIADTFLHELIHALCWQMDIPHNLDGITEENICRRISTGLTAVWVSNPEAFRWWASLLTDTPAVQH